MTHYTTHLSHPVTLSDGEWEIALVEAHYPCSMPTDIEGCNYLDIWAFNANQKEKHFRIKIPFGLYSTVQQLVDLLNIDITVSPYLTFFLNKKNGKVSIKQTKAVREITMNRDLLMNLGLPTKEDDFIPTDEDMEKGVRVGVRPAKLLIAVPTQTYVYCDLVEPQIVGDTVAPLLQIVNLNLTNCRHGTQQSTLFNSPHYVPVLKNRFQEVEIDLRDSMGNPLPFQFGTSCVKLHLRKTDRWH